MTCIYWCTVSIFRCLVFIGALVLSTLFTIQRFEPEMSVDVMVLVSFFIFTKKRLCNILRFLTAVQMIIFK